MLEALLATKASGPPAQVVNGQSQWTTGTNGVNWTVPANVYEISILAIATGAYGLHGNTGPVATYGGGSGGGGGGLRWRNKVSVTPGQVLTISIGDSSRPNVDTRILRGAEVLLEAYRGVGRIGGGGTPIGGDIGGGDGGDGGESNTNDSVGGGGGAGGYSGKGGNGGNRASTSGTAGVGGGAGGGSGSYGGPTASGRGGGGGGGVGILGQGSNGSGGVYGAVPNGGGGGSAGSTGQSATSIAGAGGGNYGSGGGGGGNSGNSGGPPGSGAVRIIWGPGRAFPSTLTTNL